MKRSIIPAPPPQLVIIRTQQTTKLSKHAHGKISYQLGYCPDKSEAWFTLSGNEGGGYFSHEWVPLSRIIDKLTELAKDGPFPAIALKSVFVGKSVNNPSFLAASLVAEGILTADLEKSFRLHVSGNPDQWRDELYAMTGELVNFQPDADVSAEPKIKKNHRGAKIKGGDDASDSPSE